VQEFVRDPADRLVGRPSVQVLSAAIPVGDSAVHVADEDGIMRKIQEPGPFLQQPCSSRRSAHESGRHERGDQERRQLHGGDRGVPFLRRNEDVVETCDRDGGHHAGRDESAHAGQQHDEDQVEERGRGGLESDLEASGGDQSEGAQAQQDMAHGSSEYYSRSRGHRRARCVGNSPGEAMGDESSAMTHLTGNDVRRLSGMRNAHPRSDERR